MREFKVNEYITLKLENAQTIIYVNGKRFNQCKFLLLNIPVDEIKSFDEIKSIDEAAERLDRSMEGNEQYKFEIPSETEFWGHCSNFQVWAEKNYDTRLLHRNIAFPLLKKLADAGDPVASIVIKEEIGKRIESGNLSVIYYLIKEGYLNYLNKEEKNLIKSNLKSQFSKLKIEEIIDKIEKELHFGWSQEIRTFFQVLKEIGIFGIKIFLDLLIKPIDLKLKEKIINDLAKLNREDSQTLRPELIKILISQEHSNIKAILESKLMNFLCRKDFLQILNNPNSKFKEKLKLSLNLEYEPCWEILNIIMKIGDKVPDLLIRTIPYVEYREDEEKIIKALKKVGNEIVEPLIKILIINEENIEFGHEYEEKLFNLLFKRIDQEKLKFLLKDKKYKIIERAIQKYEMTINEFKQYNVLIPFFYIYPILNPEFLVQIHKKFPEEMRKELISYFLEPLMDLGRVAELIRTLPVLIALRNKEISLNLINTLRYQTEYPLFKDLEQILKKKEFIPSKKLIENLGRTIILLNETVNLRSPESISALEDKYYIYELLCEYEYLFQCIIFGYYSTDIQSLLEKISQFFDLLLFLNEVIYQEIEDRKIPTKLKFYKQKVLYEKYNLTPQTDKIKLKWIPQKKWDKYIANRDNILKNEYYYYLAKRWYFEKVITQFSLEIIDKKLQFTFRDLIYSKLSVKLKEFNQKEYKFVINLKNIILGLGLERRYFRKCALEFLRDLKPLYRNKQQTFFINLLNDEEKEELHNNLIKSLSHTNLNERIWAAEDLGYVDQKYRNKSFNQVILELNNERQEKIINSLSKHFRSQDNEKSSDTHQIKNIVELLIALKSEKSIQILINNVGHVEDFRLREKIHDFLDKIISEVKTIELKEESILYPKHIHMEKKGLIKAFNLSGYFGHFKEITSIAITLDSKYIITGSEDNTIRVWELKTGKIIKIIDSPITHHLIFILTPDGKNIISNSDGPDIIIRELKTGKIIRNLKRDFPWYDPINIFLISANKRFLITGSSSRGIRVLNYETGEFIRRIGADRKIFSLAFTPNERYLISSPSDKSITIWEFRSGELVHYIKSSHYHTGTLPMVITHDGKYLISSSKDNDIEIWDLNIKKSIRSFKGHYDIITSLALSADGKLIISSSKDQTIRVWDFKSGNLINSFEDERYYNPKLKISPDGKYLIVTSHRFFDVWELDTGDILYSTRVKIPNVSYALAISPDGKKLIYGFKNNAINIWELNTGKISNIISGHTDSISHLHFSNDAKYFISGSYDRTVNLWELKSKKLIRTFKGHKHDITSILFSPDGRYFGSSSRDGTIILYELNTGNIVRKFGRVKKKTGPEPYNPQNPYEEPIYTFAFSPDMMYIIGGVEGGIIKIWELDTGKLIHNFKVHIVYTGITKILFFSNNKHMVIFLNTGLIKIWDLEKNKFIRVLGLFKDGCFVELSDGRKLICGFQHFKKKVGIFDLDKNQIIGIFEHANHIEQVLYIPNTTLILVRCRGDDLFMYDLQEFVKRSQNNESYPVKETQIFSEMFYHKSSRTLDLSNLGISHINVINGLENLTSLENLKLKKNQIKDISGLESLVNLKHLYLEDNDIDEIKSLENFIKLEFLCLENNKIPQSILNQLGGLDDHGNAKYPKRFVEYCRQQKEKGKGEE